MSDVKKVLVVGGGFAGMSAAICLQRIGIAVDLIEIENDWRMIGAGVTFNGATLRAFNELGVLDQIIAQGDCHDSVVVCDAQGNLLFHLNQEREFGPDIPNGGGILRPVCHRIMSEKTRAVGTRVRLGTAVTDLKIGADSVEVEFNDNSSGSFDLVIGADGLASSIRKMLFQNAPEPEYTGQGCWRVVLRRPAWVTTAIMYLGKDHKGGVNPVSKKEMYMFLLHNKPDNPWIPEEKWPETLKIELQEFGGILAEIREGLGPDSRINYRPLQNLLLPPPWHKGRVLLIGDAAHATTPHVAYGAGLAIEDGIVLAEYLRQDMSVADALKAFMERRWERCRSVVEGSKLLGDMEIAHTPAPEYQAVMQGIMATIRSPM